MGTIFTMKSIMLQVLGTEQSRYSLGNLNPVQFVLLAMLSYAFCATYDPFFFDYNGFPLVVRQLYSTVLSFLFLYFCAIIPYAGIVIYSICITYFAICAYVYRVFKYSMGFDLINAAFETNQDEAGAFVNFSSIISIVGLILIGLLIYWLFVFFLYYHRETIRKYGWKSTALACICAAGLWYACFQLPGIALKLRPSLHFTMADNTLKEDTEMYVAGHHEVFVHHWLWQYNNINILWGALNEKFKKINIQDSASVESKMTKDEPIVFVLIIGESVRADHIPAGGYERNTLPQIGKNDNITFFRNMFSYGTSTYVSVEGMMGALTVDKEKPGYSSFLSILKKHGFHNLWIAENTYNIVHSQYFNQLFGTGINKTLEFHAAMGDVSSGIMDNITGEMSPKQFVVIENGTGHFPYKHDPKYAPFQPGNIDWGNLDVVADVTPEQMINDYDNCIVCVDALAKHLIDGLKDKNAVILYCSDHGQKLGENGRFMHGGNPGDFDLRHVASWIWYSDTYIRNNPEIAAKTREIADKVLAQGQLYASILKLCHIESTVPLKVGDIWSDDIRKHPNNLPQSVQSSAKDCGVRE